MPGWDDHPVVVRTVGWLLLRRLVRLVGLGEKPDAKDIEIAVLQHQFAVLRRQVKRPQNRTVASPILPPHKGILALRPADRHITTVHPG
jgi:hypothetical protein